MLVYISAKIIESFHWFRGRHIMHLSFNTKPDGRVIAVCHVIVQRLVQRLSHGMWYSKDYHMACDRPKTITWLVIVPKRLNYPPRTQSVVHLSIWNARTNVTCTRKIESSGYHLGSRSFNYSTRCSQFYTIVLNDGDTIPACNII